MSRAVLVVGLGALIELASNLRHYGLSALVGQTTSALAATLLVGIAVLLFREAEGQRAAAPWLGRVLRFLPATGAIAGLGWVWPWGAARLGGAWLPLAVAIMGGFVVLAIRARPVWTVSAALVLGIFLRHIVFRALPLHANGADMMPLVTAALQNLFAGKSPYATYPMPWPLPLTYLPLTFLAYAPAKLVGVDIRWTNLLAELAVAGALAYAAAGRDERTGTWRDRLETPAITLCAWLFLLPSSLSWDNLCTAPVGWAALAWMIVLVATTNRRSPIAVGIATATTPLVAVFVPLALIAWWRQVGLRATAVRALVGSAVAIALILPWVIWSPRAFVDGVFLWFNDLDRLPRTMWTINRAWVEHAGFSGLFWSRGWESALRPIQLAVLIASSALFLVRRKDNRSLPAHAAGAFLLFMVFNPVLWPYFYQPAIVCALLAVAFA